MGRNILNLTIRRREAAFSLANSTLFIRSTNMKKTFRIVTVILLLAIWGSTPILASGPNPVPLCYPNPCLGH
jgi:hypothetical protein